MSSSPFRHTITVRYGECDMQRIVFNANYLAYADDAMARWLLAVLGPAALEAGLGIGPIGLPEGFDYVVKRAEVVWAASCTFGDVIDLDCQVTRWGTTSFDVAMDGSVAGDARFTVALTLISVGTDTATPTASAPIPDWVRTALS